MTNLVMCVLRQVVPLWSVRPPSDDSGWSKVGNRDKRLSNGHGGGEHVRAHTYVTGLLHECSLWKLSFSFRVGGAGERPRKGEVRRAIVVLWFSGSGSGLRWPHAEAALLAPAGQCRGAGRGQNQQVGVCHLCLYTSVLDHTMTRPLNLSFIIFLYGLYKA